MAYRDFAPVYRAAGWNGCLPIPAGTKGPPPRGFTGWHSKDPSTEQIQIWVETAATHSVALRMPEGVLGVDVDNYRTKQGLVTLAKAEAAWGPLPQTYMSTAREGGSGIRMFRVPAGSRFPGEISLDGFSDIELIQRGHRYSVVYPSTNPDANGAVYTWYGPDGQPCDLPRVDQLPELPESWITGIQSTGKSFGQGPEKRRLSSDEVIQELGKFHNALEEPCSVISERLAAAIEELDSPGARHDSALHHSMALVGLGHLGHTGCITALESFEKEFVARVSVDRSDSSGEFDRLILGAVARLEGPPAKEDPCDRPDEAGPADPTDPSEDEIVAEVRRMKKKEAARIRFNNEMAGEMQLPELETAVELALAVPAAPDWLVDGLIPRTGVITLSAAKKVGKTTLTMKLIKAILDEERFLDTFQCHKPAGSVCIFDLELPRDKLGQWIRRYGIAKHDVYATSLRGRVSHFNIMNEVHRKNIAEDLKAKNCACLVVDPLGPYLRMTGADENSSTEAGRALDALIMLKEEANVDTLILPLHAGHGDGKRARGSSVLLDVPDVLISLYKKSEDDDVRHFSATGRDVDVDVLSFTLDFGTYELVMLEGGTPDDARENDILSVLKVLERAPGTNQGRIIEGLKVEMGSCGKSRGRSAIDKALSSKFVRKEKTADGPKAPIYYYLTEHGQAELAQVRRVRGEAA